MEPTDSYHRAMVVVAHADDAEYGCSGTVARWCREGMEVVYVICTDGSKGSSDPGITTERLVEVREGEQLAAGRVLGLKEVVFLGYEDSMLQPTLELRRDISRQIRKFRPDVVIAQSPVRTLDGSGYIGHPDHLAAGEATLSAVFPAARDRLTFPELLEEGLEPHKVRELLLPGRHDPDIWVDVSDTVEVAIEALRQHVSQVGGEEDGNGMRKWRMEMGQPHGMKFAEAFKQFKLH